MNRSLHRNFVQPRKIGLIVVMNALLGTATARAQQDYFSNWPAGSSPQEVGKSLSEHFVTSPHEYPGTVRYPEVITWYGALTYALLTHDDALRAQLIQRFEPLMPGGAEATRIPFKHDVDDSIFGVVPVEIAIQTGDPKYLADGKTFADRQWEYPLPGGLFDETRFWIDDMYGLTILQLEAFRATHDQIYLNRAADEMTAYLDKLQQPKGLFYHATDSPFYWGRGDGWVAAGMAELLSDLPVDHPQHAHILASYRRMMAALLRYQDKNGTWRELIDYDNAWPETSGSGMFTFALITGVKKGWLEAAVYGPAARRAWIAVTGYIDQNQNVTSVREAPTRVIVRNTISPGSAGPATSTGRRRSSGPQMLSCVKYFF